MDVMEQIVDLARTQQRAETRFVVNAFVRAVRALTRPDEIRTCCAALNHALDVIERGKGA